MTFIKPLDLWNILVNNLAGSVEIFVGLALMFVIGLAAYFRMTNYTALIMTGLFLLILAPYIGISYTLLILVFIGLGIGIAIRWIITK